MSGEIECPHCGGSGSVPEDFLTEEHVGDVFRDYCEVFGIHRAYGVESYEEYGDPIEIIQDTSCRGCHNTERHSLPRAYFTRDREKRLDLMRKDFAKLTAAKERANRKAMENELKQVQAREASLRKSLGFET